MLSTFKQTLTSLQDPHYGQTIAGLSPRAALWYWSKYVIFFTVLPVLLAIFALTYYTPQFPRLLRTSIPDFDLTVRNGQASSRLTAPFIVGSQDFAIILNPSGRPSDLDHFHSGVLLLKDQILAKSPDNQVDSRPLKELGDFHLDRSGLADWLGAHALTVLFSGLILILALASILSSVYWLFHMATFFVWAGGFWLVSKLIKRPLLFWPCFNLVIFASVLPLIISAVTIISPSPVIDYLNLGLFAFFAVSWFRNLTSPQK